MSQFATSQELTDTYADLGSAISGDGIDNRKTISIELGTTFNNSTGVKIRAFYVTIDSATRFPISVKQISASGVNSFIQEEINITKTTEAVYFRIPNNITQLIIQAKATVVGGTAGVIDTAFETESYQADQVGEKIPLFDDKETEIARGNIPGQKIFLIPGRKNSISATVIDDLSQIPSTTVIPNPGGIQLELISDNVNDDGSPVGTGARTVHIEYLDTNGDEQTEDIIMNGTTAVTTTATDIDKVQWIHVVTVGSNNVAVGNISLQTVGGGIVYEYIQAGGNQSLSGRYTVPTGKTGILMGWHASGITKRIDVKLRATADRDSKTLQVAFNFVDNVVLNDSTSPWIPLDQKVPAGATVKISAISNAAGGDAGGMFKIKLIDN